MGHGARREAGRLRARAAALACVGALGVAVGPVPAAHADGDLAMETWIDGTAADHQPGPPLQIGRPTPFTFVLTNTSAARISSIQVRTTAGQVGPVDCRSRVLEPGGRLDCAASVIIADAAEGPMEWTTTVTAVREDGSFMSFDQPCYAVASSDQVAQPSVVAPHGESAPRRDVLLAAAVVGLCLCVGAALALVGRPGRRRGQGAADTADA